MRASLGSLVLAAAVFGVFVACSAAPEKKTTLCTPNKPSYCRCKDRNAGEKTCAADGNSFGPCIPCETYDNPEIRPGDPGYDDPFPEYDSGSEQPEDGGTGPASCGDGKVQPNEDCDDETDGCKDCKLAGAKPAATSSCPGLDVHVWGGDHRPTLTTTTVGGGNRSTKALCTAPGTTATDGSDAPDRIFHVTAHKTGTMVVSLANTAFNAFLYMSAECDAAGVTSGKCVNKENQVGDETLTFGVTGGSSYTVFVDGANSDAEGEFKVTFAIQ